jgi:myo-inositol-1(or 4)-monophosphatase
MDDLEVATQAAAAGAAVIAAAFGGTAALEMKGQFDPVTEVDHAAERAILDVIDRHRPDDAVLAEESGRIGEAGRRWIIDPMDGTVNFIHGIPQISVAIGLFDGDDGIVGVIHDPLRNEVFAAAKDRGATRNGAPIVVSSTGDLEKAVLATGFPYDHGQYAEAYATTLGAVLARVNGIRRFGSAALDLAWTAAGRYEGYWELGIAPWDQAAGMVILREAGGRITHPDGTPSLPETPMLVASNGVLHDELREIVWSNMPDHKR